MKTFDFSRINEFLKNNLLIIGAFVVYVIFCTFFENYISTKLVTPFFSQVHSSILNDILFLIFLIIVVIRCYLHIKNNYLMSNRLLLTSILFILLIGYYRISSNPWVFTQTYFCVYVKYLDVVLLFFISNIFIRIFHRKKSYLTDEQRGFCFDNPINSANEDSLNRNELAKLLADKITNTTNNFDSFTIGISAEWGHGKTSFLNLIQTALNEEKHKRIIINFNPWLNNDEKSIVFSFFDQLSSELGLYDRKLSKDLTKYAKLLNAIHSSVITNFTEEFFSLGKHKDNSLKDYYDSINNAIKVSGYQIVIFVDDLDRLYENEILEVLKLIRNSANFANTVFVVAYDRNFLVSALRKVNEYHPDLYLEKIFQFELCLPSFEKNVIAKRLKDLTKIYISDEAGKEEILNIIDESISRSYNVFFGNRFNINLLTNLRDVNRFFNSFNISYSSLAGEVCLLDLMNLELLRLKYLGVYNLLAKKHNMFLESYTFQANKTFLSLAKTKTKSEKGEDLETINLAEYLKKNYLEVGIGHGQIDEAIDYVYCVFPHYNYFSELKEDVLSISYPPSINRYFQYSLLDSNLSEIEFSKARLKSKQEFQESIGKWVKKGLHYDVVKRLENIELFADRDDYEKIIDSIFYYASLLHPEENRSLSFDYKNLYNKLEYEKVKLFYENEDEYKIFLRELLKSQPKPYLFVSNIIKYIFELNASSWTFILSKEELLDLKIYFFREYSEGIKKFDENLFLLFLYSSYEEKKDIGGGYYKTTPMVQEEAREIFISCARRIPDSFLKNIIAKYYASPNESEEKHLYSVLKDTILEVWNSWNNFESFLEELKSESVHGLEEFMRFYELCKNNSYSYIEFEFKDIDLTDAVLFSI